MTLKKKGIDFNFKVPHKAFNRQIGSWAAAKVSPEGTVMAADAWNAKARDGLPSAEDRAYVQSLMGRVVEPGQFANWISPPTAGSTGSLLNASTCASTDDKAGSSRATDDRVRSSQW